MSSITVVYVTALPLLAEGLRSAIENFRFEPIVKTLIVEDDVCNNFLSIITFEPNLIFLASNLPGSLELVARVRKTRPNILIIMMGYHYTLPELSDLMESGVHGIVSTNEGIEELEKTFYDVISLQPNTLQRQYARVARTLKTPDLEKPLTSREMEIIRLLPTDLSAEEIGLQLGIEGNTVSKHIQNICQKLGAKSARGAIGVAIRKRIL